VFYAQSPGARYRSRSGRNIADELEILIKDYGVKFIFFVDEDFLGGTPARKTVLKDLIREIRKRKLNFNFLIECRADYWRQLEIFEELVDIGLFSIFIGVESSLESVLDRLHKGISPEDVYRAYEFSEKLGLYMYIGYILFDPYTTFNELQETIERLFSPGFPPILHLHGMGIVKGTPQAERLRQDGLMIHRARSLGYTFTDTKVKYFSDALDTYCNIYRPVVLNTYKILFMAGNFPRHNNAFALEALMALEKQIVLCHKEFLCSTLDMLEGGHLSIDYQLVFTARFARILSITNAIHSKWRSACSLSL